MTARRLLARNSRADATRGYDAFAALVDRGVDGIGAAPSAADLLAGSRAPTAADLLGYVVGDDLGDDDLGGWFSSVRKAVKRVGRYAKKAARSKALRLAVGGAAVAFPALAPAAVTLEAANRVLDQYESGSREARTLARRTIQATKAAARAGDPGAQRAMHALKVTFRARTSAPKAKAKGQAPKRGGRPVVLVMADGRRVRARLEG